MLSFDEAKNILIAIAGSSESPEDVTLVGGQAVEFWRQFYDIKSSLGYLTKDIDFYGSSQAADNNFQAFVNKDDAELHLPSMDDSSPNSAKITFKDKNNQEIEIDYLNQVTGLSDDDIETYSPVILLDGLSIKVLHQLLCMESKINNLAAWPAKRKKEGIEQARLSVEIAKSFIINLIDNDSIGDTFEVIERIFRFSCREPSLFSFYNYEIDTLKSIPIEKYPNDNFKSIRYPQIIKEVDLKRKKFAVLMEKRKDLFDVASMRIRV